MPITCGSWSAGALPGEHRGHPLRPIFLGGGEDAQLVVDENIVVCRIAPLDVVQRLLLVDVDQHIAVDRLGNAGSLDLARLEDDVAVGQDHRRAEAAQPPQGRKGVRVQPIGERIVQEIGTTMASSSTLRGCSSYKSCSAPR